MQAERSLAQRWEDAYPSVLSLIITSASALTLAKLPSWVKPVMNGVVKLAPAALNVSAIAVGFLATAQALLLSLTDSEVMHALREGGHYIRLTRFFARALAASFTAALLSALLSAMQLNLGGALRYVCVATWTFSGIAALFCYYRASRMLSYVLRIDGDSGATGDSQGSSAADRRPDIEIIEG